MSQVPATQNDMQFANTGLEDMSTSDLVLPRIKIVQTEGMWQDNLSQIKRPVLRFIPLGLVKQRVLFHHNVEDNDVPMCKSSDFENGFPNPDAPRQKSFPWEIAGLNPADFPADAEGNQKVPCAGCKLKDWGSSPIGDTPYCSEQWTLPIYFDTSDEGIGEWAPAILTLQKSSIKPIRTFFTQFAQSNKPPFEAIAQGTLRVQQRGQVTYSIPTFTRESESPRERWLEFYEQYQDMRNFLTRPPLKEAGDVDPGPSNNVNQGPAQAAPQDPWAGQPQQAAPAGDPWAAPAAQAAPVQQAPVQAAPPVQEQAPVQAAPVQTAPPVQEAPVQTAPPVQAQSPVQAAPAPQAPAGQELPF